MTRTAIKLSRNAEQCFVATSDWIGALVVSAMPDRSSDYKPLAELKRKVERAAEVISSDTGIPLEEIITTRSEAAFRNRLHQDFEGLLDFHTSGSVRGTTKFENIMWHWGTMMLEGYKRLGNDLSKFGISGRQNPSLLPNILDLVFMQEVLGGSQLKSEFMYKHDSRAQKERTRHLVEEYLAALVEMDYLTKIPQRKVGEPVQYQFTSHSHHILQFYMNTLSPLIRFSNMAFANQQPLKRLTQRLETGDLNVKYFYIDADAEIAASIIEGIKRHEILNGTPYLFHHSTKNNKPIGNVNIYVADLRGEYLSEPNTKRLIDRWSEYVTTGTVIAIVDEAIQQPIFEEIVTPYKIIALSSFLTREDMQSPPGLTTLFGQVYHRKYQPKPRSSASQQFALESPQIKVERRSRFRESSESPQQRLQNLRALLAD